MPENSRTLKCVFKNYVNNAEEECDQHYDIYFD